MLVIPRQAKGLGFAGTTDVAVACRRPLHSGPPAAERSVTSDPKLPVENGPGVPNQPNSAPADNGAWILNQPRADSASHVQSGLQLWLHRSSVFLFVLISAVAGVLLLILPWTPFLPLASYLDLHRFFSWPVQRPGFARHLDWLLGSPPLSRPSIVQCSAGPMQRAPGFQVSECEFLTWLIS